MKKAVMFSGLFILLTAIYLAGHAVIYFALVEFFTINNLSVKEILIVALIFLALSFYLATWLSYLHDNKASRAYYFFAGVWLGMLVNLLLFFAITWLVILLSSFLGVVISENILGILAICTAIIYSTYGIWNAFTPKVTRVDIAIDNLPEVWVGRKIVQISDLHLGHIFDEKYMNNIARQINFLSPDIIVITGDLFDGTDRKLETFISPLNRLKAPLGIFYEMGNHEIYLGRNKVLAILNKTKIVLLGNQMCVVDGLQFIGIDYPEQMQTLNLEDSIKNIPSFDRTKPSILLWHIPTQIEGAKNAGISLQLSGHTHKGQLFPFGFITSLIYKGYDYGFKRDGSFAIYTSSGLGGWGPPMRTEKTSEIVEITLK